MVSAHPWPACPPLRGRDTPHKDQGAPTDDSGRIRIVPMPGPGHDQDMNNKQLTRIPDGKMIAGVCSGAAKYLGVDVNLLRLILAVFTLFFGTGVLAYALGWLLIPEQGKETSILQDLISKQQQKSQ